MTYLVVSLICGIGLCFIVSLFRWWLGPHSADRILLFDLATSLICGLLVLVSILFNQKLLLDIALLLAVISFVSAIGLAYWLERGTE